MKYRPLLARAKLLFTGRRFVCKTNIVFTSHRYALSPEGNM